MTKLCPVCGSELKSLAVRRDKYGCPNCSYTEYPPFGYCYMDDIGQRVASSGSSSWWIGNDI